MTQPQMNQGMRMTQEDMERAQSEMMHSAMLLQIDRMIAHMNRTYDIPVEPLPTEVTTERLQQFKTILTKECAEIDEVLAIESDDRFDRLTAYADLLGDIIVYCWSEMFRHGIPMAPVMGNIMDSNMTKLGEDGRPVPVPGQPGKFGKGPNFEPPEPKIREGLMSMRGPSALEQAGVIIPG